MSSRALALIAYCTWLGVASVAGAIPPGASSAPPTAPPLHGSSPLFGAVASPNGSRALALIEQAAQWLARAGEGSTDYSGLCRQLLVMPLSENALASTQARTAAMHELARAAFQRRARIESALARLDAAIALLPDDPELLHARASALALVSAPADPSSCRTQRRDQDALRALLDLRARHTGYLPQVIAFELGVLYTRLGDLASAARAYEEAMALDPAHAVVARTNLAEVTMLREDFETALDHYDRALDQASTPREQALSALGRAVVLERLGEHPRAMEQLKRSFGIGRGGLEALRAADVFFEPERELAFYEAVTLEALADADGSRERDRLLRAAATSYHAFLADSPPRSVAAAAEAGLARVRGALEAARSARARKAQRATTSADTLP